jgi:hypothetical protein
MRGKASYIINDSKKVKDGITVIPDIWHTMRSVNELMKNRACSQISSHNQVC